MSKRSKLIQEEKSFKLQLDKISDQANKKEISITGFSILTSQWNYNSNFKHYACKINNSNITQNDSVDVNFDIFTIQNNFAQNVYSASYAGNGYVEIYSSEIPSTTLNGHLVIQKGVM